MQCGDVAQWSGAECVDEGRLRRIVPLRRSICVTYVRVWRATNRYCRQEMGLCPSSLSDEEKAEIQKSTQVDKVLAEDRKEESKVVKVLLLGTGESGSRNCHRHD